MDGHSVCLLSLLLSVESLLWVREYKSSPLHWLYTLYADTSLENGKGRGSKKKRKAKTVRPMSFFVFSFDGPLFVLPVAGHSSCL